MLIHRIFVYNLFGPPDVVSFGLIFAGLATFLSHGVSHVINFIGKEEYKRVTTTELFTQPYRRMTALHVAIIVSGWGLLLLGSPIIGLLVVIILKSAFDIVAHRREHSKFSH